MKVDLYLDVLPGMDVKYLIAFANPSRKTDAVKRFKITADIPDSAILGEIDGEIQADVEATE